MAPLIRCYQCSHFKPIGRGYSGWCQDAKPKIRVQAVDFCDSAEAIPKGGSGDE